MHLLSKIEIECAFIEEIISILIDFIKYGKDNISLLTWKCGRDVEVFRVANGHVHC